MLIAVLIEEGLIAVVLNRLAFKSYFGGDRSKINYAQCSYEMWQIFKFVTNSEKFFLNCHNIVKTCFEIICINRF